MATFVLLLKGIPKSPKSVDVLGPYTSARKAARDAAYMTDPKRNRTAWTCAYVCGVLPPLALYREGSIKFKATIASRRFRL